MMIRSVFLCLAVLVASPQSFADLPDFTDIVEEASPAVVKILVEYESDNPRYQEQLEELPEYLRRFLISEVVRLFLASALEWAPGSLFLKTVMS